MLVHDFMVGDAYDGPAFAAWYLLHAILDNPSAECLTPGFVKDILQSVGFEFQGAEVMLEEITTLARARKP